MKTLKRVIDYFESKISSWEPQPLPGEKGARSEGKLKELLNIEANDPESILSELIERCDRVVTLLQSRTVAHTQLPQTFKRAISSGNGSSSMCYGFVYDALLAE